MPQGVPPLEEDEGPAACVERAGPDQIAFTRFEGSPGQLDRERQAMVVNADGTGLSPLEDEGSIGPRWSPDGEGYTFSRSDGKIYLVANMGESAHNLTGNEDGDYSPHWHWRGILFQGSGGGGSQVFFIRPDGSGLHQVTEWESGDVWLPQWAPDGDVLAFGGRHHGENNDETHMLDPETGSVENLTQSEEDEYGFEWSPDGSAITFHSDRFGQDDVWVLTRNGERTRITDHLDLDRFPKWSPDGEFIAWVRTVGGINGEIWVARADGTEGRRVTAGPFDGSPAWSPDGTYLAFDRAVGYDLGPSSLWRVGSDGTDPQQITADWDDTGPRFRPRCVTP